MHSQCPNANLKDIVSTRYLYIIDDWIIIQSPNHIVHPGLNGLPFATINSSILGDSV